MYLIHCEISGCCSFLPFICTFQKFSLSEGLWTKIEPRGSDRSSSFTPYWDTLHSHTDCAKTLTASGAVLKLIHCIFKWVQTDFQASITSPCTDADITITGSYSSWQLIYSCVYFGAHRDILSSDSTILIFFWEWGGGSSGWFSYKSTILFCMFSLSPCVSH